MEPEAKQDYMRALKAFDFSEISAALDRCLLTCKFRPSLAEVMEASGRDIGPGGPGKGPDEEACKRRGHEYVLARVELLEDGSTYSEYPDDFVIRAIHYYQRQATPLPDAVVAWMRERGVR